MTSLRYCCAGFFLAFSLTLGSYAQELPTKSGPEDLEAEAKKLMDDLPTLDTELPVEPPSELPNPEEDPGSSVERLKKSLERAKQKQQRWEKLARRGVLSRAEAETCLVEVANALAKYEQSRVTLLKQQLINAQERANKGEVDRTMVEAVEAALQSTTELAATAEQQARSVRLAVARNNLNRHQKLHAAGLISRVQLQKAESKVRLLETETDVKNPKLSE